MGGPQASGSQSTITQIGPIYNLHRAAELGDLEQINRLLANLGINEHHRLLSSQEENGKLPLHFAAQGGHGDALELLLPKKIEEPTNLQDLVNAQTSKGGWSALHLAAAYGHTKIVQWLFDNRRADLNLQDHEGNTPLHLAVHLGHREVTRYLVTEGANLYILNNDRMMPISFCEDHAMFDALFSTFTVGSASFNKGRPIQQVSFPLDDDNRTILHYAAQFASNSDAITKLITETVPDQIYVKDNQGDSFLHVAAKSGNMNILQALKKLGPGRVDVTCLLSNGGRDALHSPGMYALLYNHRDFFDELITMGKVEITLSCIIKGLIVELLDKPEIQHRLALFASTLPTYLALYANKDCIFNFLLETKLLTLSQWDDEHKRTCLHWAVLDKRTDIVEKLCCNVQLRPGIQDADGKTALQHAFEQNNHMLMETLRAKRSFKEHEEKLERDREVYVQVHNAILVGAALIASVTFAGWLQMPGQSPDGAGFGTLGLTIFWASNSISFFTAVATMCVTTTALIPTPCRYVGDIVNQLQVAIVIDAGLLAVSLAAVMWAFAAAGFATLHQTGIFKYQAIMRSTVAMGGFLCIIVWLVFVLQFYRCAPPKSVLFALLLPSLPCNSRWWPASLRKMRARIGDSSRFGYPIKLRSELKAFMDRDLVAYHARQRAPGIHAPPASNLIPLETMKRLLGKLDISNKVSFIKETHQQRKNEIAHKGTKEAVTSRITSHFGTPNPKA